MLTRRTFLKDISLVALAPTVPTFLSHTARAAAPETDGRILVVIQLDGGNDGINTVVPFADEGYAKNRQALRLPEDGLLKISDELALHPSLREAADLFEQQRLAVVQGVGYPNPDRSHAVSMAIWHSAGLDQEEHTGYGWIGRALDGSPSRGRSPDSLLIGDGATPNALSGRRSVASSLNTLNDLATRVDHTPGLVSSQSDAGDLSEFLRRKTLDAYSTAEVLADLAEKISASGSYPSTALSGRLQLIAQLIKADLGTRVYYAVQPGYDTHAVQLPAHSQLLSELAGGIRAFLDDLRAAGLEERVLVMCFSEFGRRVKENASEGTDHGTAGPVLLAGGMIRPGVHGQTPNLLELENDDPKHTVDFRSVYATVLADWLGLPTSAALDGEFTRLDLVHAR